MVIPNITNHTVGVWNRQWFEGVSNQMWSVDFLICKENQTVLQTLPRFQFAVIIFRKVEEYCLYNLNAISLTSFR